MKLDKYSLMAAAGLEPTNDALNEAYGDDKWPAGMFTVVNDFTITPGGGWMIKFKKNDIIKVKDLNFETQRMEKYDMVKKAWTTVAPPINNMDVFPIAKFANSEDWVDLFTRNTKPATSMQMGLKEAGIMGTLGGEHPMQNTEMINKIVKPSLGPDFQAVIMFKDSNYKALDAKYPYEVTKDWKTIYRSSNYQGYAQISPDGSVIKAAILDGGGIVGAYYIKGGSALQEVTVDSSVLGRLIGDAMDARYAGIIENDYYAIADNLEPLVMSMKAALPQVKASAEYREYAPQWEAELALYTQMLELFNKSKLGGAV